MFSRYDFHIEHNIFLFTSNALAGAPIVNAYGNAFVFLLLWKIMDGCARFECCYLAVFFIQGMRKGRVGDPSPTETSKHKIIFGRVDTYKKPSLTIYGWHGMRCCTSITMNLAANNLTAEESVVKTKYCTIHVPFGLDASRLLVLSLTLRGAAKKLMVNAKFCNVEARFSNRFIK